MRRAVRSRLAAWFLCLALPMVAARSGDLVLVRQYATTLCDESPDARQTRHQVIALRRQGPAVMVRRGATAMAPENSIESCVAALSYGADGCEVDVRRTRDGILVLFDDEALDRITDGFGPMRDATLREMVSLRPKVAYGRPLFSSPPTFAALLDVARQQNMLLDLHLREPGLESDVARLLEEADAWDHVTHVSTPDTSRRFENARLRPLAYKARLCENGRDMDPAAVAAALARPGAMLLVDDPRVAARLLGRAPYQPLPYTTTFKIAAEPPLSTSLPPAGDFGSLAVTRALAALPHANSASWLLELMAGRRNPAGPQHRLTERAWAARRLGDLGQKPRPVISALLRQARKPTPHPDRASSGLDALTAIQALGQLGATECAGDLIGLLYRPPTRASRPGEGNLSADSGSQPRQTFEFRRTGYVLRALGELPCGTSRRFLERYVRMDEVQARRFGPPQFDEATRALLHQRLAWDDIARLLRSSNPGVRTTAILECLDAPTEERTLALRTAVPWALDLPRAKR
ncbi:MAG: glycerophosphodiester phosphodiesterase family protein [Verrucomicrobia bacterium]|nr:glycerophosphodiester phosphodiesterase family protein [Verrucomicrobiota bacterium]